MNTIKHFLSGLVQRTSIGKFLLEKYSKYRFRGSASYWENRYANKGDSGAGAYGDGAKYKADMLNKFVKDHHIQRAIELGCGDGNQLSYLKVPEYIGVDVSPTAIEKCKNLFKNDMSKQFYLNDTNDLDSKLNLFKADLSLSLDVIYHLVENDVFEKYMYRLFEISTRYVIIYSWDIDGKSELHVRHRKFTPWIHNHINGWQLIQKIDKSFEPTCEFYIYKKDGVE